MAYVALSSQPVRESVAETGPGPAWPVPGGDAAAPPVAGPGAHRQAAAAYLRELLLRPGRTSSTWEQYAERNRPGHINQLAVAEVLARHLWDYPRRPGDDEILPRQLKDTASRALSGKLLSKSALRLFMDAFSLPSSEREQLWKLWEGSSRIRVLSGPRSFAGQARVEIETALGPVQGGTGLGERFTEVTSGFFATDMLLAKTLRLGETLTLEHVTSFKYAKVPVREMNGDLRQYRRAVRRHMENVDIRVEFDPCMLPRHVWWAVWNGVAGNIISQESVSLDGQNSAQRFLRFIENTVAGFHWQWQPRGRGCALAMQSRPGRREDPGQPRTWALPRELAPSTTSPPW